MKTVYILQYNSYSKQIQNKEEALSRFCTSPINLSKYIFMSSSLEGSKTDKIIKTVKISLKLHNNTFSEPNEGPDLYAFSHLIKFQLILRKWHSKYNLCH